MDGTAFLWTYSEGVYNRAKKRRRKTLGHRLKLPFALVALLPAAQATSIAQTASVAATDGTLVGRVADKTENVPIRNAFVYVHGDRWHGDVMPPVNAAGEFRVQLTQGLYDVFIASGGFRPTCAVISITTGKTTSYDVNLSPDNEHLQQ
jgi:hypothetical protein